MYQTSLLQYIAKANANVRMAPRNFASSSLLLSSKRFYMEPPPRMNANSARDHAALIHQLNDDEKRQIMSQGNINNIRNFSIIAHIDHGKSTLSDRILSYAGNISSEQRASGQVLDKLEVERARGITVKAQTASVFYRNPTAASGNLDESYLLNLIDCPGHVDFSYEVSRSLAACQGALLLVDAAQGIQAQTLANFYIAMENNLTIVPVMTKIDLPNADIQRVTQEMVTAFDVQPEDILLCSSKSGQGVPELFPEIVKRIPPPSGVSMLDAGENILFPDATTPSDAPFKGLLFDSWYDTHRGVICLVKVEQGTLMKGDIINTYHEGCGPYEVIDIGLLTPTPVTHLVDNSLRVGQVGYIVAGIKTSKEIRLGDTFYSIPRQQCIKGGAQNGLIVPSVFDIRRSGLTEAKTRLATAREVVDPLPGFQPAKSMVFAGLFPSADVEYSELISAIEKLTLNDASVTVSKEHSEALGPGFRCGFLGMLHLDVFTTRLQQEFGAEVITTAPTVPYRAMLDDGIAVDIESPGHFPDPYKVEYFTEPMVKVSIITPHQYVGALTQLCGSSRGEIEDVKFISEDRALMRYTMPLAEVVVDFYQEVKSISSGYASVDYEPTEDRVSDLIKLEIRVNNEPVDALSVICHRSKAETLGRRMISKLKESLDRQNFEIIIQVFVGNKSLGKEKLAAYRKDVLIKSGKLVGGGDMTRKKKLLEKQKEGKKRMKAVGNVEISDQAFLSAIKAQSRHG